MATKGVLADSEVGNILADADNRVPAAFSVTPYFAPYVRFWFDVYTRYPSDHIIIHDKTDLGVVYAVLDFSMVTGPGISRHARAAVLQQLSQEKSREVKEALLGLGAGKESSHVALNILKTLRDAGRRPPQTFAARTVFFRRLAESVRTQTGQRDIIEAGLHREAPYRPFLQRLAREFQLPHQLLSIPFLESSFNDQAESSVGALGIWQFMPLIASYFMPKRESRWDYRMNPIISSVAAMHLLRENHNILKRWDLAVTAYNSGTKHLVRARRELGKSSPSLEAIFRGYRSDYHGFASKNFYSEFLALVHAMAYQDRAFPRVSAPRPLAADALHVEIAKCSFTPEALSKQLGTHGESWLGMNAHLRRPKVLYPKGTIVVSATNLPTNRFTRLSFTQMVRNRPLKWAAMVRGQSCSTK